MALDINKLLGRAAETRADIQAKSGGGDRPATPPMGTSRWRILPGWRKSDPETFYHAFSSHFLKDNAGKVVGSFVCRGITFGEHCEYCDAIDEMRRGTKDQEQLNKINEFRAGNGYLVGALRVDGENASLTKPVLLRVPQTVLDRFLQLMIERLKNDEINILDPNEGRNITINREGTGRNTKYNLQDAAKSSKVDPAALEAMIDIDDYIEKEINRGKSNMVKFSPTVRALASSIGLPAPTLAISGSTIASNPAASSKLKEISSGDGMSSASISAAADAGKVINADDDLPWEDQKALEAEVVTAPAAAAAAEAKKEEVPAAPAAASSSEPSIDDILAGL